VLGVWKPRQEGSRAMEPRNIAAKTLSALAESRDGIGAVQWFCTDEASVPFQWHFMTTKNKGGRPKIARLSEAVVNRPGSRFHRDKSTVPHATFPS
jgi:hypothetical protein